MNLVALPPGAAPLESIAAAWLAAAGGGPLAAAEGLILLPTRRAARALSAAFLRANAGRALLLPRISAFGALDEAPLALAGALDLPLAVNEAERLGVLARFVLAAEGARGRRMPAERAWALARELAALQDEAERAGVDLAAALPNAVPARYAEHWQTTLRFLAIVTKAWPAWLAERGLMNPTARRIALLGAQAERFREAPPSACVWAIASGGESPAEAKLLRAIGDLPHGLVILPGLDRMMDEEPFRALGHEHPEHADAGIARLLEALGVSRAAIGAFPASESGVPRERASTLRRVLLPASRLSLWTREPPTPPLAGISRLPAIDQQHEAVAIALVLRAALEEPGARAALITPDRTLARRVGAELLRFGIVADDSAGEALGETPPAVFLRLLAEAIQAHFAPLPLLSLLKHPLCALGLTRAEARTRARELEKAVLRGPGPAPGLASLAAAAGAVDDAHDADLARRLVDLVERLRRCLAPFEEVRTAPTILPDVLLRALITAAEALTATEDADGEAPLWALEEGEALAHRLADLVAAYRTLPPIPPDELANLLAASLAGVVVRSRRALRGRGGTEHPRVFIWGLLEARLQSVEVAVLGGLTEGTWPPATDPGPWLSRPMSGALGLPPAEEAVGRAAQDFLMAALAAPRVVLSNPRRREGAPAVPARWLMRLEAMLHGYGQTLPIHPALAWATALDRPNDAAQPVAPPEPRPPVRLRPRHLSVSEIAEWVADPYTIYARHILKLRPLREIAEAQDAADFGTIVHGALARFFAARLAWPERAEAMLLDELAATLTAARLPAHLEAWWWPRLPRIAHWVVERERERRDDARPVRIATECKGEWRIGTGNGAFVLSARADRIERRADGRLTILDYKTGRVPSPADIKGDRAPQLPLEAAIAQAGGFGAELSGPSEELLYWPLNGRGEGAEPAGLIGADAHELVQRAIHGLEALIARFDDPDAAYLPRPHPGHVLPFAEYDQLARVAEWDTEGE